MHPVSISSQLVHDAARALDLSVGWNLNSSMTLPELRALRVAPQSSVIQLIPLVPRLNMDIARVKI